MHGVNAPREGANRFKKRSMHSEERLLDLMTVNLAQNAYRCNYSNYYLKQLSVFFDFWIPVFMETTKNSAQI